jgi:uncharacterized protein (TIGR03435 family)
MLRRFTTGRLVAVIPLVIVSICFVRAQGLRFDVASVKPIPADAEVPFRPQPADGAAYDATLKVLIGFAYTLEDFRIRGVPDWADRLRFSITAKAGRAITDEERRVMLRQLLRDRFALDAVIESQREPVLVMTAARSDRAPGPAMKPRPDCPSEQCKTGGSTTPGHFAFQAGSTAQLARLLTFFRRQVVVDETGFSGVFDYELSWRPELEPGASGDPNDGRPSFFTALEEQLGVKLTADRRPIDVLIVRHVEPPTPD